MKYFSNAKTPLFFTLMLSPSLVLSYEQAYDTLSTYQVKSYIRQCLASFDFALDEEMPLEDTLRLKKIIKDNLFTASNAYIWTMQGKQYKKTKVDRIILKSIIQFIEERSYEYVYQKTANHSLSMRIATSIVNEVRHFFGQATFVDPHALAPYFGTALVNKLETKLRYVDSQSYYPQDPHGMEQDAYQSHPTQDSPPQNGSVYARCCDCNMSLGHLNRLYLQPCGHEICPDCAHNRYLINNYTSCPYCWITIDVNSLAFHLGQMGY